ncbi:DNA polymerase [Azospirillum doebereinerae]|uniref:DNA-directed DNA polymerase n=1 Tax=Azospirillum doebereinerae TaxID=92933 RepID=A0A3S0V2C8_9PROT|nr:DNA polymerase [Azospirillum doebereinerae]RUQ60050.1 hypothetical protein EJ913_30890 [Azospirillum doebereinerae]
MTSFTSPTSMTLNGQDAPFVPLSSAETQSAHGFNGPCNSAAGVISDPNYTTLPSPAEDWKEPVIIGFDTEWAPHPKGGPQNIVLIYAFHIRCGNRSAAGLIDIMGGEAKHRITLGRLIGKAVIRGIKDGVIPGWPDAVTLAVHYGRGDLAALRDFAIVKRKLDAVKGVLATTTTPLELDVKSGEPMELLPTIPKGARNIKAWDRSNNPHEIKVTVRDTFLLAEAGGQSLEALGRQLGFEKLHLPEGYSYEDMARFKTERRAEFDAYALRDAEVAARYFQWFHGFCRDTLSLPRTPPTLGACAVQLAQRTIKAEGVDIHAAFGTVMVKQRRFSEADKRYSTRGQRELIYARKKVELVAADAYHGGRTETYMTGPVAAEELRDIDLQAAYPTAMSAIGVPDYEKAFDTTTPADFTASSLGFAELTFDTPEEIRFPVFGVRTERGLIFPRRGRTIATAPEIATALSLGVEVKIIHGTIVPWDTSVRPFESFVVEMLRLRRKLKDGNGQDTSESRMVKTLTNSLYGKIAQGVRPRTVFDARSGAMKSLSPSALTNPILAAYITGLPRATIAEMLNSIPRDHKVVSVSTDGFLTSADLGDISLDGPASRETAAARLRIAAALDRNVTDIRREVLEVKRRASEVVSFRNRGIATTRIVGDSKPILAKSSVKAPADEDPNAYMLGLYRTRTYRTRETRRDFMPLRAQIESNADLVTVARKPRINLDPDMKRKLVNARMMPAHLADGETEEMLATDSVPYETVEEALMTMGAFHAWRDGRQRVLKTLGDWQDWDDYRAAGLVRMRVRGGIQVTRQGSAGVLKRQFLRALARGAWGISRDGWTNGELAAWLTQAGYPTTESDVKNAGRRSAKLVEHSVAASPAALALLRVILPEFPSLDLRAVFAEEELEMVMTSLDPNAASIKAEPVQPDIPSES